MLLVFGQVKTIALKAVNLKSILKDKYSVKSSQNHLTKVWNLQLMSLGNLNYITLN